MKSLILLLAGASAAAAGAPASNPFGVWAYMGRMPTLSAAPYVRGKLVRATWADLEPSPGDWRWDDAPTDLASSGEEASDRGLDSQLAQAAAAHLQIVVVVFSGSSAPEWVYAKGVPRVRTTGVVRVQSDHYPYYLNPEYQGLVKNLISKVREHLEHQPPAIRRQILAVQAGFSSTGDFYPYHGDLIESKYDISDTDWLNYYRQMALYYEDQYRATKPLIRLLLNPSNAPTTAGELIPWLRVNCPHAIIKIGNTGHMYQINDEREQVAYLRSQLFASDGDDYLHARSEFGEDLHSPGWVASPAWNMWSLLQAGLYTGLDMECLERGDQILANRKFFPAFAFFNRYAGQKDPATAPGAWCGLRDGLDAADTRRFPVNRFGAADRDKTERYLKIAAAFADHGARENDPAGALLRGIRSRPRAALNDVGWDIYPGNYEVFLEQLRPNETSAGYWRVGSLEQPYGRYGRGFDHAKGQDALQFRFDPRYLVGDARSRTELHVVYFDGGSGSWSLRYRQEGELRSAKTFELGGSKRWVEAVIPIDGAGFGAPANEPDLELRYGSGSDTIFSLVEARR